MDGLDGGQPVAGAHTDRLAEFTRKKADHDYLSQELELRHNTELT
jgi:hypothetical protein